MDFKVDPEAHVSPPRGLPFTSYQAMSGLGAGQRTWTRPGSAARGMHRGCTGLTSAMWRTGDQVAPFGVSIDSQQELWRAPR
jgi:hypothetical protein